LDSTNRVLLDRVQRSFPLVSQPYRLLAEGLGMAEDEVRERLRLLKEQRLIRQISAIFNTGALGYRSSLVAMAVPEGELDRAARCINAYPGVSHNYLRPGTYNMWFTVAVPPGKRVEDVVGELAAAAGGWPTLILPALRRYKLAVVLDVLEEGDGDAGEDRGDVPVMESTVPFQPTDQNICIVRCVQEDLPLVDRPFKYWADEVGLDETELLRTLVHWVDKGIVRRFAAVLNHRQVGFSANGMLVWNCPVERVDEYGRILASYAEVSHCYHRPAYAVWPYNLYAMVHGRSIEDCRKIAEKLAAAIGLYDYLILFSTREFKKTRLKLFWD